MRSRNRMVSLIFSTLFTVPIYGQAQEVRGSFQVESLPKRSKTELSGGDLLLARAMLAKTVEKSAIDSKVHLPREAKEVIVKDFVFAANVKGESLEELSTRTNEIRKLFVELATRTKGTKLTARSTESFLVEWKTRQATPIIPALLSKNAALAGVRLDQNSAALIKKDLLTRVNWMARSHLPVEEIERNNVRYLMAVFAASKVAAMDSQAYARARQSVFNRIIRLTIRSKPAGADVEVNGTHIGKTVIENKPFEAAKEYVFLFRLKGHKQDRRNFYVLPDQATQEIEGILFPEDHN